MKKLILILTLLIVAIVYFPTKQTEAVYVPVTVSLNDTLFGICSELADKYGDERDIRDIVYYAKVQNGVDRYIQPGDKLVVELFVERGDEIESETH